MAKKNGLPGQAGGTFFLGKKKVPPDPLQEKPLFVMPRTQMKLARLGQSVLRRVNLGILASDGGSDSAVTIAQEP